MTKVFTALLLAEMASRGDVSLGEPVAKVLPADQAVPVRGGRSITFADLATHTSGLPFMTDRPPGPFLAQYELLQDPGTAWHLERRTGVTVLMNRGGDVSHIARHILRPDFPLTKPTAVTHTEIALDRAALDVFTGSYEAGGECVFAIVREGDALMIESPAADWGLPKLRLRAKGPRELFARELPLLVTFAVDEHGRATGMVIHPPRGQKAVSATRMPPIK